MAHGARTLQHVDEAARPFFGLSLTEACAVLASYMLSRAMLPPTMMRGLPALVPPLVVYGVLVATHRVRWEPYAFQVYGYAVRRLLGWPKVAERPYVLLEVDGATRDALTPEEQDLRLIGRLQAVLATLGTGAAVQLVVTNRALDTTPLLTQIRTRQRPQGQAMSRLADRRCDRLLRTGLRSSEQHFYVAVYGATPRRLLSWGQAEQDAGALDDLSEQVRAALGHMGLAVRRVAQIADVGGTVTREHVDTVELDDGQHAASLYMLIPPGRTDPGWLDTLVSMPGPYRLAVWVQGLDADREIVRLEARQRHNDVNAYVGLLKRASGPAATTRAALEETDDAILRLRQPGQGIVQCGVCVTVLAPTAAEARKRARQAMLRFKAAAARPATGRGDQWPLYQATRPGPVPASARHAYRMDAETAANAYPFNRANPSTVGGFEIGTTTRGELVRLDPTDPSLRNALVVIFGLSGMGKSFFTLKCMKEWLLMGHRVTILDRSGHYEYLRALAGGVTVSTVAELDAVPAATRMVVVDLRAYSSIPEELRQAVDRRVQTPYIEPDGRQGQHGLVLEEAWALEYQGASLWVNDLARRGRHWGGFVLVITHDPADLLNNPVITSMFSAAAIKIAFALDDKEGIASRLGSAMGLTPREIATVKTLRNGECYVMRHNKLQGSVVRGTVDVSADPDELWLFETYPQSWQYQRRQQEIERQGGDVAKAIFTLADSLPFHDEEEVPV